MTWLCYRCSTDGYHQQSQSGQFIIFIAVILFFFLLLLLLLRIFIIISNGSNIFDGNGTGQKVVIIVMKICHQDDTDYQNLDRKPFLVTFHLSPFTFHLAINVRDATLTSRCRGSFFSDHRPSPVDNARVYIGEMYVFQSQVTRVDSILPVEICQCLI